MINKNTKPDAAEIISFMKILLIIDEREGEKDT